ncbi:STA1 [Symbiodinium sp. KB8]|nr:STA1 [Symbiodinium sp. KB8]
MGLMLLFEPRPHADSQSINSFFRVLLNAIRKSFQDKFDHGLVGGQAYSWLMSAVDEAMDCATQELNSRQVEDFMDEEMKAVHSKAGRGLLMDILQPVLIEYLCLQKHVGHSTLLDRVAERVSAAKAFAYHTAKAKVETLWAFIETHEELLGTSMSIERYPALVECINRVIETARADLAILAETMPLRYFFSKHGMALRIILHNRVTQLARAASKGWITDQEAEVLIGELQARIREANNFYPRSTYIRLACSRSCGPKFGAQPQKNAWDDFDLALQPSFGQGVYIPEVELLDGSERLSHHLMSKALQECPTSGLLWAKAIELEPKQGQNAKSVDALKKCENDAHVIIAVAKLFWRDGKNAKARKWFNRAVTLNPRLGDAWGAYLAFELENGTSHEQREVIRKCVDAEPNQGLEWNKTVKKVANWRAKWAVKLKRFVEEVYPTEFNAKPLNREVELLLQGEDPYAAMATAQEEAAAEKDELDIKDEGGVKQESFEPATTFQGAKPGWCFKMGMRGLGYYRDPKQDQGAGIKGEVKQEGKAKVKEEDEKK